MTLGISRAVACGWIVSRRLLTRAGAVLALALVFLLTFAAKATTALAQGAPPANPAAATESDPLRVRVRVKVLEWYLRNQLDTGFTLNYLRDVNGNNVRSADATFPSLGGADGGISAFFDRMRVGPGQMEMAIQALEDTERLKVLSEPVLTVNARNKGDAKFFSGQENPYETLRSANGILLGVTEFRETGITLKISDTNVHIADDNPMQRFVSMQFNVEVSRLGQALPVAVDEKKNTVTAPQVLSRKLNTSLFVPEHMPFIAGIIKSRIKVDTHSGIPLLSEIPYVGVLFRSTRKSDQNTELVFLVTSEVLWPENGAIANLPAATPAQGASSGKDVKE